MGYRERARKKGVYRTGESREVEGDQFQAEVPRLDRK
jgi:hypothetical protein